jgi:hypothetical protein
MAVRSSKNVGKKSSQNKTTSTQTYTSSSKNDSKKSDTTQEESNRMDTLLNDTFDRLGILMTKGMDLAETGFSLGINMIDRFAKVGPGGIFNVRPQATSQQEEHNPPEGEAPHQQTKSDSGLIIVNSLRIFPGTTATITFSLNNDSVDSPKSVILSVDGFNGQSTGAQIDSSTFSITPRKQTIAPADFEKFTIQGPVPMNIPADTYTGFLKISGDEEASIPVAVIISKNP